MKTISTTIVASAGTLVLLTAGLGSIACKAQERGRKPLVRDDLFQIELPDGSKLSIRTTPDFQDIPCVARVGLVLRPKGLRGFPVSEGGPLVWSNEATSVDYRPGFDRYYALVKVLEDRILIFFTWNSRYLEVDKQTGRVLRSGEGDDVLKESADFVPLKLKVFKPVKLNLSPDHVPAKGMLGSGRD